MKAKYNGHDVEVIKTEKEGDLTFYHVKKGDLVTVVQDKYVELDENLFSTDIPETINFATEKFHCPECGSYMFGSSDMNADMKGHCHGNEEWSCDFTWFRKDDHLYFRDMENKDD